MLKTAATAGFVVLTFAVAGIAIAAEDHHKAAKTDAPGFERFKQLNVRSNQDLDKLVERAQSILHGVEAQNLRDNGSLRQHIATALVGVQASLDGMLVDRPRRRIVRNQEVQ